jgi:photosystem II stability/assembly factor-like uncharacterized protein
MKSKTNIILYFFILLLISKTVQAQQGWFQQTSGTTNDLWAVSFTNENNGTVVGDFGTILRTTDGGTTWIMQFSGTSNDLFGVSFTDENNGTAVGGWGTILSTTDGGTSWYNQYSGTTHHLYAVCFTDVNNGTAVGLYETILRTTNGGLTWITQSNPYVAWLEGVSFTDENSGTAVGAEGHILRTTDGGQNWVNQTSGTIYSLWGVSFTDANHGTAVGLAGIFRTTNGGTNWINQINPAANLEGVSFTDLNNGTVVGSAGTILRTTDGGTNWTSQESGTTNTLYGISFTDYNNGTAVGESGTILRTLNGGGIPVELTSFTASVGENDVTLKWQTATEKNNSGFEIQKKKSEVRSQESDWEKIGFVQGHGTTTEPKSYSFTDKNLEPGSYSYKLVQIDFDGTRNESEIVNVEVSSQPTKYSLSQNYPNPFNPSTTIEYSIPERTDVKLTVINIVGEKVAELVNRTMDAGSYSVVFDSHSGEVRNLASGVYFYTLQAGKTIVTKKMLLLK